MLVWRHTSRVAGEANRGRGSRSVRRVSRSSSARSSGSRRAYVRRARRRSAARGATSGTSTPTTVSRAPIPAVTGETVVPSTDQSRPVQRAPTATSLATLYPAPHSEPVPSSTSPTRSPPRTRRAQRSDDAVVTVTAVRCATRYSTIIWAMNGVVA